MRVKLHTRIIAGKRGAAELEGYKEREKEIMREDERKTSNE